VTPHAPKTAALEALAAGLLSDDGERRIRAHLSGCDVCREHFATIHVYRESQELIVQSTPEVGGRPLDWSKMEQALAREAQAQIAAGARASSANDGRYPWLVGGAIAVAAVVLLAIGLAGRGSPTEVARTHEVPPTSATTEPSTPQTVEIPRAVLASGVVSMLAGSVQYAAIDGTPEDSAALEIGQRVLGGRLETNETSQAQLVLEGPPASPNAAPLALAQVAVGPSSQLSIGDVESSEAPADGAARSVTAVLSRGRTTIDAFETSSQIGRAHV
jgi:hypothetical protein